MPSFQNIFVSAPASSLLLEGHYDLVLVGLSVLVAILSAYGALLVSQHVLSKPSRTMRRMWITGGGLCLGAGIWAMHFIGMLAFELPCTTGYDTTLTLLSTVPGILASVLVVNTISHQHISTLQLFNAGALFGAGVGAMHYTGMAAMRINGLIRYDAAIFSLSILVAVVLAVLALWLKFKLQRRNSLGLVWVNLSSAVVMGLAVSGMHYTAMLAAYFVSDSSVEVASGIDPSFLAMIVLLLSGLIVVATIFATFIELPSLASMKRSLRIVTLLVIGWIVLAWLGTNNYYAKLSNAPITSASR
jgi:NO-binding membrane sensor protein with MHYT domain